VHMVRKQSESEFAYRYMYMDVPGRQRLWLENADNDPKSTAKGKTKIFGYTFG
jgi:import inner membrane translocase subunit TIM21